VPPPLRSRGVTWVMPRRSPDFRQEGGLGRIYHFSTFALVELPQPRPLPPPSACEVMVVDSDFIQDEEGNTTAAFLIITCNLPEIGETRLFRMRGVDPAWDENLLPSECLGIKPPAEQLTCYFPSACR